jgi:hypothetical protein
MTRNVEINEEKRIVTVTLTCEEGTFKGVAKCLKSDHFDPAIGEKIAYKRALLQVKKADIDIFKKEIDACEQVLKQVEVLKKRQRRAKANYKKAKAQLSNIHAEIEKLKHVTETVVKENVQQASLTGRYFVQEVKSEHRPCVRYRFIKVLDQLSNFKSKVYIIEISACSSGTYKSSSQNMYLDILANDTIRKMEEISEQEFNKYLPQETGSKKHSDLFDAFLSLLNF